MGKLFTPQENLKKKHSLLQFLNEKRRKRKSAICRNRIADLEIMRLTTFHLNQVRMKSVNSANQWNASSKS